MMYVITPNTGRDVSDTSSFDGNGSLLPFSGFSRQGCGSVLYRIILNSPSTAQTSKEPSFGVSDESTMSMAPFMIPARRYVVPAIIMYVADG
nr:hypothetical protein EATA8330_12900 [Enterobacter asburiae]